MSTKTSPGRLLRLTLQIYRNQTSKVEEREKFAREYLAKVAALHAKNGIEMYQQVGRVATCPPAHAPLNNSPSWSSLGDADGD